MVEYTGVHTHVQKGVTNFYNDNYDNDKGNLIDDNNDKDNDTSNNDNNNNHIDNNTDNTDDKQNTHT